MGWVGWSRINQTTRQAGRTRLTFEAQRGRRVGVAADAHALACSSPLGALEAVADVGYGLLGALE